MASYYWVVNEAKMECLSPAAVGECVKSGPGPATWRAVADLVHAGRWDRLNRITVVTDTEALELLSECVEISAPAEDRYRTLHEFASKCQSYVGDHFVERWNLTTEELERLAP